ncbi:MAG: glycosyltransferase family 2 protein [Actinobacteria bacterium]|nr:glycosyltransferase family 2 protein [Actinomycetota bacterium]
MPRPASHTATWMGGFAIAATIALWLTYILRTVVAEFIDFGIHDSKFIAQTISYVIVMTFLTFSALMYLLARQGSMYRTRTHVRVPRAEIDAHFAAVNPSITVLIPSYREDPEVVRATLLSAALQEFPCMRIVLLIDDPPNPTEPEAIEGLAGCRALPGEVTELLAEPRDRFVAAMAAHERASVDEAAGSPAALRGVAIDFAWAADWLSAQAAAYPRTSNADEFVADEVLGALGGDFDVTSKALFAALDEGAMVPAERISQLYRRLIWTFSATLTSFERKTFAHLPHDANKAMNLNAYIGLMGHDYAVLDTRVGLILRETDVQPTLHVPDSDYLLTLDADSVLLREYCLRLAYHLALPGNERIAVIQTPYSAFRGAPTRLERIAGATTDIQHVVHQGLTYYNSTFWVGANAIIRKVALNDIEEVSYVDGYEVRRYVQDRTVIEDTESSIDLVAHGWSLYNYPERLSYSATPPDFGSLVVQRARWANGGLLIMPKFWRYIRRERKAGHKVKRTQVWLRFNYMASIAWSSLGLVFLLLFPYNSQLLSPIILAAALPYFLAMSYDFHRLGYKRSDVFRVYGFNLILLSVNLAGTFKSLQQAAAKSKIAFARTPKVKDRTASPALFVLSAYLIAAFSFYTLQNDVVSENWSNAVFAGFNGLLTTYSIIAFIGLRNSIVDVAVGMAHWVRVPVLPDVAAASDPAVDAPDGDTVDGAVHPGIDWEAVLFFGPGTQTPEPGVERISDPSTRGPRRGDTRSRHRGEASS